MKHRVSKYFELSKDVNCIPKGVYKCTGRSGEMLTFSVGKKIFFGISSDAEELLKEIPFTKAITKVTPSEDFLDRYYSLLEIHKTKPEPLIPMPFTYCCMEPSVFREMH